jgi:hypothetical protein
MDSINNAIDNSLEEINNIREKMKDKVKSDEGVTMPGEVLLSEIIGAMSLILQDELIRKEINSLSEKLDDIAAVNILNILTASTIHSAFKTITLYDTLLKEELTAQFDRYGTVLNNLGADTEVLKIKMNSSEKKVEEFTTKLEGEMGELKTMIECEELNNLSDRVVNIEIAFKHMENEFAELKKKLNILKSTLS